MAIKTRCLIKDQFDTQKKIVRLYKENVENKVPQCLNDKSFKLKEISSICNASPTSVKAVLQAWFNINNIDDPDALNKEYIKLTNAKESTIISTDKKEEPIVEDKSNSNTKEIRDFKRVDPDEYLATIIPSIEWYGMITLIQELIEHREQDAITMADMGMPDTIVPKIRKLLAPYTFLNPHNGKIEPHFNFVSWSKNKEKKTEIEPYVQYEGIIEKSK
tara:strand:+ start:1546 stop:2199 length:654 start_codon:yes stop_codon:yes gene_type:complete